MLDLMLFAVAGFAATFVDGALGMGFGPTSSSILLGTGLAPAVAATYVNIAKLVTGVASAIARLKCRGHAEPRTRVGSSVVPVIIAAPLAISSPAAISFRIHRENEPN